jgi:hypothetical protein
LQFWVESGGSTKLLEKPVCYSQTYFAKNCQNSIKTTQSVQQNQKTLESMNTNSRDSADEFEVIGRGRRRKAPVILDEDSSQDGQLVVAGEHSSSQSSDAAKCSSDVSQAKVNGPAVSHLCFESCTSCQCLTNYDGLMHTLKVSFCLFDK